jgi:hypothetical protein
MGKPLEARVLCARPTEDSGMLLLQHEGALQVDLVANYVVVFDQHVHVLHPRTFDAPERLGGTSDSLVYSILEASLVPKSSCKQRAGVGSTWTRPSPTRPGAASTKLWVTGKPT